MAYRSCTASLWTRVLLGLLVWCSCCSTFVLAHPHVFADYQFAAVFDAKGLKGVEVSWTFDEMYSAQIIKDFHSSKGNTFTPAESKSLLNKAFAELPQVEYFTLLRVDGTARPVKQIKDFSALIKGRKLCLSFFVPCVVQGVGKPRRVEMLVLDEEFFIDFELLVKNPVSIRGADGLETRVSVKKDQKLAYYFGQVIPRVVTLSFWKKK